MPVEWTPHRFSGGALALDVANTVVRRDRPEKRFDRFAEASEIGRFAAAASGERVVEFGGRALSVADCEAARSAVIAIRETTDALFRDAATTGELRPALLGSFLRAAAAGIDAGILSPLEGEMPEGQRGPAKEARRLHGVKPSATPSGLPAPCSLESQTVGFPSPSATAAATPSRGENPDTASPLRFEAALARSALSLLPPDKHRRIRICPNCAWLFLDRSRNRSRTWCDMAVCGNREKARRHRRSQREKEQQHA